MGNDSQGAVNVLFVCTGNICRSPTAEGVFLDRAAAAGLAVRAESAGIHGYHVGEPPDDRTIACARGHGVDLSAQRARKFSAADFRDFDLIIAMDRSHLRAIRAMDPGDGAKVTLFMRYAGADGVDVPDPYYGGDDGFERVYRMIEIGVDGLIASLR